MTNQAPFINLSSLWTGLAQAAAIGTFVLVFNMYVDQSVMKEQQKTTSKDIEDLKHRVTDLEMIIPDRIKIKEDLTR